ncbi:MAG: hypothetical protein K6E91_15190, partial [Butyrivibrio sp.]|nr:hypothetical protein [Butyrivibrio sp.]
QEDKSTAMADEVFGSVSQEEGKEILELLYPEVTSQPVFIATADMAGIAPWFGRFGYEDDERYKEGYSVLLDRNEYSDNQGKAGWKFMLGEEEVNLIIEKEEDSYKAYTSYNLSDDGENPLLIDRILVTRNGITDTIVSKDSGSDETAGYTLVINKDGGGTWVSLMSDLVSDSVFGRMFYKNGEGLEHFVMDEAAPGSGKIFTVK